MLAGRGSKFVVFALADELRRSTVGHHHFVIMFSISYSSDIELFEAEFIHGLVLDHNLFFNESIIARFKVFCVHRKSIAYSLGFVKR